LGAEFSLHDSTDDWHSLGVCGGDNGREVREKLRAFEEYNRCGLLGWPRHMRSQLHGLLQ
jgi:hypothetical protein